tara:strand:- start:286 stop:426 length:141 start_codon:yes stop_codon:yes gene_type:complete
LADYRPTPADIEWLRERSETETAWKRAVIDRLTIIAEKPPVVIRTR